VVAGVAAAVGVIMRWTSKSGSTPIKPSMQSFPSLSHKCSNFFERHHALDAHTTNFYTAALCRFTEFSISPVVYFSFGKSKENEK